MSTIIILLNNIFVNRKYPASSISTPGSRIPSLFSAVNSPIDSVLNCLGQIDSELTILNPGVIG